ncbi:hypothetical protein [Streptomyces europaeiscabiei]|uniref:hypothetical protein n=1 Tax=Streptomyces europaeiscabiei TaxID=146819 RepID=UPI002E162B37|nr:hypothetical protein OHB30_38045 [Streptomyces europaeiscabiei]
MTVGATGPAADASSGAAVADSPAQSVAVGSPWASPPAWTSRSPSTAPVTGLSANLIAALNPRFGNITADH